MPLFLRITVERQRMSSMPSRNSLKPARVKFFPLNPDSSIFSLMCFLLFTSKSVVTSFFRIAVLPFGCEPVGGLDLLMFDEENCLDPVALLGTFFLGSFKS